MSMETLAIPDQPSLSRASERTFKKWFSGVTAGGCVFSSCILWQSSGWGTIGLMVYIPLGFLVWMLLGVVAALMVRHRHPESKIGSMLAVAFGMPLLAFLVTVGVFFIMPHRGGC